MLSAQEYLPILVDYIKSGRDNSEGLETPPKRYFISAGNGSVINAFLNDTGPQEISVSLQRKIVATDVSGGQLIPMVQETVVQRGGKRSIRLPLNLAEAERLHILLGQAIVVAKERQNKQASQSRLSKLVSNLEFYFKHLSKSRSK